MNRRKIFILSFIFLICLSFNVSFAETKEFKANYGGHFLITSDNDGNAVTHHSGSASSCGICKNSKKNKNATNIGPCGASIYKVVSSSVKKSLKNSLILKAEAEGYVIDESTFIVTPKLVKKIVCGNDVPAYNKCVTVYATAQGTKIEEEIPEEVPEEPKEETPSEVPEEPKEEVPEEPEEPVHVCSYQAEYHAPQAMVSHVVATAYMSPNHCPSINNIVGEPIDNLYYIGEQIDLSGTFCKTTTTYSTGYTVYTCSCGATRTEQDDPISPTTEYSPMKIQRISGVELVYSNGATVGLNDIVNVSSTDWKIKDNLYVKEWKNVNYSNELGTSYGIVELVSSCGCGATFTFYIPGPKPLANKNTDLKINITPQDSGKVTVTYQQVDSTGKITTKSETLTGNGGTIKVVEESNVSVKVTDSSEHTYINTTTRDGNIITQEKDYTYLVPAGGAEIYVNFMPSRYTLYVTSSLGGEAYITSCPERLTPIIGKDSFGVRTETVYDVNAGENFTIEYKAKEGYEFAGWEYRLFVNANENDEETKIVMPASDLTVTAIFKRSYEKAENPTLYVTSNNETWGTAYVLINGSKKSISEAVPGEKYKVYFESSEGFYFTNWEYDCAVSPFEVVENHGNEATIIMTEQDLEVKAMFAPIPRDNKITEHSVDFRPEPPYGGDVPEDISKIITGATVTIAVTPHKGYVFDRWEFYNSNGGKIIPDYYYDESGTGYFIMPDYAVEAVAYFKYVGSPSKITVIIQGEGKVTADGIDVISGGIIESYDGENVDFEGTPEGDWQFKYWVDEDGNILSEDPKYIHEVDGDITIIAVFESKGPYTLYVSSMFGGKAWISKTLLKQGSGSYNIKNVGPDSLGKTVYKIENVYAGDKFEIKYEVTEDGYEFGFWEYKPYILPDSETNNSSDGTIKITMPASDLTVTAVFKKEEVKLEPKLSVTTNNAEWGRAWTKINGKNTVHDQKYNAVYGEKYTVYYEANPGYYFVNWNYSTLETPFTNENIITMPNMDLEVMAMFSPIPSQGDDGHKITFKAEPSEGGSVPDDLENILPGSQVTIAVTPNRGWEFDSWEIRTPDGNVIDGVTIEYNPSTGSGYFVMPDKDVIAVAVFKEKESYKLYVTHYYGGDAWTLDNDGTETTTVENAYVGEVYKLFYRENSNYKFDHWEFRWAGYGDNSNSGGIDPIVYEKANNNLAIMPRSDMTVTAVFKEITTTNEPLVMVSTNNTEWGDAWIEIDGKPYCWSELWDDEANQWRVVEAGKKYTIGYKPYENYEFTNWWISEEDAHCIETIKDSRLAILTMPDKKIEVMAFFKPGKETEKMFDLTVKALPEGSGTAKVKGAGSSLTDIQAGTEVTVEAEPSAGYKFKYWYNEESGKRLYSKPIYSFRMPSKDMTAVAYFEKTNGYTNEDEDDKVNIIIKKEGNGGGSIYYGNVLLANVSSGTTGVIGEITAKAGSSIQFRAVTDTDSECNGWFKSGKRVSGGSNYQLNVENNDITLTVSLNKEDDVDNSKILNSFKIVSVRDLNWKDYFVQNGQLNSERYFGIPSKNTTMLQDKGDYKQPIKMGYAVEFELITTGIAKDNADLVITPSFYYNGTSIDIKEIKDYTGNKAVSLASKFSKITIDGKTANGKGSFLEEAQDIHENVSIGSSTITDNKVLWRWIYYLPSNIAIDNRIKTITPKNGDAELLVKFDIQLMENGKAKDIVVNANKVLNSKWDGSAFKYSLSESLLDDIYNNAQN